MRVEFGGLLLESVRMPTQIVGGSVELALVEYERRSAQRRARSAPGVVVGVAVEPHRPSSDSIECRPSSREVPCSSAGGGTSVAFITRQWARDGASGRESVERSASATVRSATTAASSGSWVTSSVVTGRSSSARSTARRSWSSRSRPVRGSSSSTTAGSAASVRASATRLASPPDSSVTSRSSNPARPTRSSQLAADCVASVLSDARPSAGRT